MKTVYHEAEPDTMYHLEDLSKKLGRFGNVQMNAIKNNFIK